MLLSIKVTIPFLALALYYHWLWSATFSTAYQRGKQLGRKWRQLWRHCHLQMYWQQFQFHRRQGHGGVFYPMSAWRKLQAPQILANVCSEWVFSQEPLWEGNQTAFVPTQPYFVEILPQLRGEGQSSGMGILLTAQRQSRAMKIGYDWRSLSSYFGYRYTCGPYAKFLSPVTGELYPQKSIECQWSTDWYNTTFDRCLCKTFFCW